MSSSYENENELELGLGLSLRSSGKEKRRGVKIMTAKDFPGTQRGGDCVGGGYSTSPGISQVVGWPPVRTQRMNSLTNQTKSSNGDQEDKGMREHNATNDIVKKNITNNDSTVKERRDIGYLKVNMDGLTIGRKVDLSAHTCYQSLAQTIDKMFFKASRTVNSTRQASKLLDGSSEFVLTYEDKEGDWMLVGDVPWRMFISTAKRLRIMKTSEANGLAPRFQERRGRRKS